MKNPWKKGLSVILCIALMLSCNAQVFALTIDYSDGKANIITDREQQELDARVKDVIQKIDEIGVVKLTDSCLSKIEEAENSYNSLTDKLKMQVTNYNTLKNARTNYEALKAANQIPSSHIVNDSETIENIVWTFHTDGLLEISGSGIIPSDGPWCELASSVTSIFISDSITGIEESAFGGFNNLKSITLPFIGKNREVAKGVESQFGYIFGKYQSSLPISRDCFIGDFAPSFGYKATRYSASSTEGYYYYKFNIPSTIETVSITDANVIGKGAFHNCSNIDSISFNNDVTSIGDYAFYGCTELSELTIPKLTMSIGSDAIPESCTIYVYHLSAGYDYRTSNRKVLDNLFINGNETYYYIEKEDGFVEISGCETSSTELTIPEKINNRIVSSIGNLCFSECKTLKSITIPTNIKTIGKYAFNKCTGLVNATIPTTVDSVGDYAFNKCTGLKNVTISEGVKNIGDSCFYNCILLSKAIIPDSVETIGSYAFYNCKSLTTAIIGTKVNEIEPSTFSGCVKLNTVLIGVGVKSIGAYAFYNCALTKITVPEATIYIGKYAFANNKAMVKATHKNGIATIDSFAYQNCSALETVSLPSSLKTISDGVFQNCASLKTATLPTSLTILGEYAFDGCSSLPSITIPAGITIINDYTFNKCTALVNVIINSDVTSIGLNAFKECAFTTIALPNTLETIKSGAFKGCVNLNNIFIPGTTKTIGAEAFLDCSSLSNISVADSIESFGESALENNNDLTVEVRYCSGIVNAKLFEKQGICHVILDGNITSIGDYAFAYCYNLSTVTHDDVNVSEGEYLFSNNIFSLGNEIFKDAFLLKNLIIPDTIETIGANAFYNSSSDGYFTQNVTVTFYFVSGSIAANILKAQKVSNIVVDNNITSLGDNAFKDIPILKTVSLPDTITFCGIDVFTSSCENVTAYFRGIDGTVDKEVYKAKLSGLTHLVFDGNIKIIGTSAFENNKTVKDVLINNTAIIEDYAFANCESLYDIIIENAGSIGKYAFYRDKALNYVRISDCITISDYAFAENLLLKDIEIDSVKNINDYAFFNDIAIDNLHINKDLHHIGNHAFDSCKSIPQIVLPETVREIGSHAFYDCNSMKSINIPVGVAAIKEYTFFGCASLLDISIPDTVLSVGDYAYYGCVAAKALDLSNTLKSIGAYAFYNCNQIKEIILPNTLKSIGDYAFRSCSSITEIYIPDSVTYLGDCVFYACTGLEKAEFGSGITKIGNSEFYGCVKFKELMLNGYISYIHELAFYGAEDAVIYSYKNPYVENYCEENGLEYRELTTDFTISLIPPIKTEYSEFEELDLNGLTLDITYKNGVKRFVTTGYTVIGYDSSAIGTQTVTVTYRGVSASFDVNVIEKEISYITSSPSEIFAYAGDTADSLNISVILHFIDGTSREITSGFEIKNNDPLTVGTVYIPIVYKGHTTTAKIVVNYKSGDINGDGTVDIRDLIRLKKILSGQEDGSGAPSDIDGNGTVDAVDLTELKKLLMNAVYKN